MPASVRAYLAAQVVSITGVGIQAVVFPLIVLTVFDAPWVLAAVAVARAIGLLAVWPVAGWVVDRAGALGCAAVTHVLFAATTAGLAVVVWSEASPWWIVLVSFVIGALSAVDMPARRGGVLDLVPAGDVPRVMALASSATWTGRLVGAAAGAVVWSVAPVAAFALNAVSYLGPAWVFFTHRAASARARHRSRPRPLAAFGDARGVPGLVRVIVAVVVAGCVVDFGVAVPLAVYRFGTGTALAVAEIALAGGAVAAGVLAARIVTPTRRTIAAAWLIAAAGFVCLASSSFPVVLAGIALAGAGVTTAGSFTNAATATAAPGHARSDLLAGIGVAQWATSLCAGPLIVAAAAFGPGGIAVAGAFGTVIAALVTGRHSVPVGAGHERTAVAPVPAA